MWFQKISDLPPHGGSLEIPRGGGGFKGSNFRGVGGGGGLMGNYFPKGVGPRTKYWKQGTIDLKRKNIPTYFVLKRKSVLLAIEMSLTSLALMFLFFFELASTTISRRTMCLWNDCSAVSSRIIWDTSDFGPYLPVSRLEFEISWIIAEVCHFFVDSTFRL